MTLACHYDTTIESDGRHHWIKWWQQNNLTFDYATCELAYLQMIVSTCPAVRTVHDVGFTQI